MQTHPPILVDSIHDLVRRVRDGCTLVVPADYGGSPAAAARAIVRQGSRGLRLVGGPPSGYVADLLVGAGCVAEIEMPGVILGDFGLAPRFRQAVSERRITLRDTTCPAFHAGIEAARKGLPFMPMRGLLGSDILHWRPEWKTVENPYAGPGRHDEVVLIPAFSPDVVLFHAICGDRHGNVWVGKAGEVIAMAQAARSAIATFEYFYEGDLLEDKHMAPATVSHIYMDATAHAAQGSWPLGLATEYRADAAHMQAYARLARTDEGFSAYLEQYVTSAAALDAPAAPGA